MGQVYARLTLTQGTVLTCYLSTESQVLGVLRRQLVGLPPYWAWSYGDGPPWWQRLEEPPPEAQAEAALEKVLNPLESLLATREVFDLLQTGVEALAAVAIGEGEDPATCWPPSVVEELSCCLLSSQ